MQSAMSSPHRSARGADGIEKADRRRRIGVRPGDRGNRRSPAQICDAGQRRKAAACGSCRARSRRSGIAAPFTGGKAARDRADVDQLLAGRRDRTGSETENSRAAQRRRRRPAAVRNALSTRTRREGQRRPGCPEGMSEISPGGRSIMELDQPGKAGARIPFRQASEASADLRNLAGRWCAWARPNRAGKAGRDIPRQLLAMCRPCRRLLSGILAKRIGKLSVRPRRSRK